MNLEGCAAFLLLSTTQATVIWKEGISTEKIFPEDWYVGKSLGALSSLMIDVGGPRPPWVVTSLGKFSWAV